MLGRRAGRGLILVSSLVVVFAAVVASPLSGLAASEACSGLPEEPLPFPGPASIASVAEPSRLSSPSSLVGVGGREYAYRYIVDGAPAVIRGMGYNPRYFGLRADERERLYERDFASMVSAGVNTVFGWNPTEFDGLTLDVAARYGLGVAPPYDFDWHLDYADPAVRSAVKSEVLNWVYRYRDHPAVRMWAIGNETLHKLVPPSWCPGEPAPEQRARARAFADFYAELIDEVHALDPYHPVLYREAEDSYVAWQREALAPGGPRPWFVYGLNVYSPRLAEVLANWPQHGFDVAVMVSEFGPGLESRPDGFRDYWAMIRSYPERVIGGAVYVWFTEGPEEVDRVYGLVDPWGNPVDGSLSVVEEIYRAP